MKVAIRIIAGIVVVALVYIGLEHAVIYMSAHWETG